MVRKWCNSLKTKDIVCLQEIKIVGFQAYSILKFIWDKATGFYSNHLKGKGGNGILIGPLWADKITTNGSSPCHRALWIIFLHNNTSIGICNLYASNYYRERVTLCEWLANNLPKAHWIFTSDFNMLENKEDKTRGKVHCWKGFEQFF